MNEGDELTVLAIAPSLVMGGAERALSNLLNGLVGRGHRVTLMTLDPSRADAFELDSSIRRVALETGMPSGLRPSDRSRIWHWFNWLRSLIRIRSAISGSAADVVLSWQHRTNARVLASTLGVRIPIVVVEQNNPYRVPLTTRMVFLRKRLLPKATTVVVLTEFMARWARSIGVADVAVIPNGIERPVQLNTTVLPGHRSLLGMGRLVHAKGFDLLIRAFSKLKDDFRDWHLSIVGEGEERTNLEGLVRELHLVDRVHLPGSTSDPLRVLASADLFAFPSRYEGFPLVLLEALVTGLPVVAADCDSGPGDMIQQGVNGILVQPEDVTALAKALADLMSNEPLRSLLGDRARDVIQRFSSDRMVKSYEQLFQRVVRESSY